MQFVKETAKEMNCAKVVLGMVYDNIPLREWYQGNGFVATELHKFEKVSYTVATMEYLIK